MPGFKTSFLLLSLGAAVIAVFLGFRPQILLGSSEISHCYDSVTTLSDQHPHANCFTVSVSTGRFTRVFEDRSSSPGPNLIRHSGTVIPGLWDGHGHILDYGAMLKTVRLFGSKSLAEVNERIKDYAKQYPEAGTRDEWIRGNGWDQAAFGRMPVAEDLEADPALKGKYIMLYRVDSHCMWVSQAVIDLLPDPIPDVPGGEVITDPGKGVLCDNAMDLVLKFWPKPDKKQQTQYLDAALKSLHSVGLVGVHDASVLPDTARLYNELVDAGKWTLRIHAMLECPQRNTYCPESAVRIDREDHMLAVRAVKLFADGALGSWGSAMIDPYTDHPSSRGSLLANASTLTTVTQQWAAAGYQVNIHAIGDLANRLVVDAFTATYPLLCPSSPPTTCQSRARFRIEHAQIIHPDDQARIFTLGLIPSIQPTHATSDMAYAEDRLGPLRTKSEAYRMRSFLPLDPVLGSDFPVEPPDPLHGMYAAVTRKSPATGRGRKGVEEGWFVEEALTLEQALRGFTVNPAKAAFLEGMAGVIKEGAFADWVVLDEPLVTERLRDIEVRETWVAGKQVFAR